MIIFLLQAVFVWAAWIAIRSWASTHKTKKWICSKCTYELHGLTEPRCPECGLDLTHRAIRGPGWRKAIDVMIDALLLVIALAYLVGVMTEFAPRSYAERARCIFTEPELGVRLHVLIERRGLKSQFSKPFLTEPGTATLIDAKGVRPSLALDPAGGRAAVERSIVDWMQSEFAEIPSDERTCVAQTAAEFACTWTLPRHRGPCFRGNGQWLIGADGEAVVAPGDGIAISGEITLDDRVFIAVAVVLFFILGRWRPILAAKRRRGWDEYRAATGEA